MSSLSLQSAAELELAELASLFAREKSAAYAEVDVLRRQLEQSQSDLRQSLAMSSRWESERNALWEEMHLVLQELSDSSVRSPAISTRFDLLIQARAQELQSENLAMRVELAATKSSLALAQADKNVIRDGTGDTKSGDAARIVALETRLCASESDKERLKTELGLLQGLFEVKLNALIALQRQSVAEETAVRSLLDSAHMDNERLREELANLRTLVEERAQELESCTVGSATRETELLARLGVSESARISAAAELSCLQTRCDSELCRHVTREEDLSSQLKACQKQLDAATSELVRHESRLAAREVELHARLEVSENERDRAFAELAVLNDQHESCLRSLVDEKLTVTDLRAQLLTSEAELAQCRENFEQHRKESVSRDAALVAQRIASDRDVQRISAELSFVQGLLEQRLCGLAAMQSQASLREAELESRLDACEAERARISNELHLIQRKVLSHLDMPESPSALDETAFLACLASGTADDASTGVLGSASADLSYQSGTKLAERNAVGSHVSSFAACLRTNLQMPPPRAEHTGNAADGLDHLRHSACAIMRNEISRGLRDANEHGVSDDERRDSMFLKGCRAGLNDLVRSLLLVDMTSCSLLQLRVGLLSCLLHHTRRVMRPIQSTAHVSSADRRTPTPEPELSMNGTVASNQVPQNKLDCILPVPVEPPAFVTA